MFWSGINLNKTYNCPTGKEIHAALILVSCDVLAARKICGHISALVSCHRCEKKQIMNIDSIILLEWLI